MEIFLEENFWDLVVKYVKIVERKLVLWSQRKVGFILVIGYNVEFFIYFFLDSQNYNKEREK